MIIDGIQYEPVNSDTKKQIIIAHRGFVYLGDVEDRENEVVIRNAMNVRSWGTKRGLGQLALEGKQPDTVLDACGVVRIHPLAIVARIDCDGAKW